MMKHKKKTQIYIGIAGAMLVFFLWKMVGAFLPDHIPPVLAKVLNIIAAWPMALPPLLVTVLSGSSWTAFGLSRKNLPRQILLGIGTGLAMATILTLLPMLLLGKEAVYSGAGYESAMEAIGGLLYFIFVIGLSEEFVFRIFLYGRLDDICISDGIPIFLSSALFGLLHLSGFNLIGILLPGLIGAFFCICKKNIPGCTLLSLAIAHGIHDWMIRLLASLL